MRLSRRGAALLVASAVIFAAGEASGFPFLRVVAGAALAAVVAALLTCLRRLRVSVARQVIPDRVQRGDSAVATITLGNPTARRVAAFLAHDLPSRDGEIRVRSLAPGERASYTYPLSTERRGRVTVGPLTVMRRDLLGLASVRATTGELSALWVHPRRHPVRIVVGAHPRHHHDGVLTTDPMRGSTDLRAVREYTFGDEPRHLHWRATARTGRLMVRDYVDPVQPRFGVLLDTRAGRLDPDGFEAAVEVAASLVHESTAQGIRTRLTTTTGLDLSTSGGLSSGRALLDALCEVDQRESDGLSADALAATCDPGGSLVLLTGGVNALDLSLLAAVRRKARQVVVIDLGGHAARPDLPGVLVIHARDVAGAVAAWNEAVNG